MFKFLFGNKKTPEVVLENDRTRFARLVAELNEVIDTLPSKPPVTFDPETGHILPETPEQFADEALALPAPAAETAKPTANPAITEGDGVAGASAARETPAVPPVPPTPAPNGAASKTN